jgi:hypothetical protein
MCEAHAFAFAVVVVAAFAVVVAVDLAVAVPWRSASPHAKGVSPSHERTSACRNVAGWLRSTPRPCGLRGGPLDAELRGYFWVCGAELLEVGILAEGVL